MALESSGSPDKTHLKLLRKTGKYFLYIAYLFVVIFILYYFVFYRPFASKMENTSKPKTAELQTYKHADLSILKQVGTLKTDKKSSFPNFQKEKPEGIIRIGCFGDSFTYGSEVDSSHDFPSMLDDLLEKNGYSNAEVLNFGSPWHGFHQAFILWDKIGKILGCDYILLGPSGFHPSRETAFNHTDWTSPYYLHSRFILSGNDLELINVNGEKHKERFLDYFSLIPKKRYLRYDRNTPVFLRCLIPEKRNMRNIFYYSKDIQTDEAHEIYRRLLPLMAGNHTKVIIGHYYQEIVDLAQDLNIQNISSFKMYRLFSFPYSAPKGHNSPFGNQLVAEQFMFWLSGKTQVAIPIIVLKNQPETTKIQRLDVKRPISYYKSIKIGLNGISIGHFINAAGAPDADRGSSTIFNETDIVSLLCFKGKRSSLIECVFIPLNIELNPMQEVKLKVRSPSGIKEILLGKIDLCAYNANIGILLLDGIKFTSKGFIFSGNSNIPMSKLIDGETTIFIGNKKIFNCRLVNDSLLFLPSVNSSYKVIRANSSGYINPKQLKESGYFTLDLESPDGTIKKIPFSKWAKAYLKLRRTHDNHFFSNFRGK